MRSGPHAQRDAKNAREILGATLTEKQFMAAVLEMARLHKWRCYHAFDSRRSEPGFPDLVLVRDGRIIFAELKTATGRLTDEQSEWIDALEACPGVEVRVWRPDALKWIEATLRVRDVGGGENGRAVPAETDALPDAGTGSKSASKNERRRKRHGKR